MIKFEDISTAKEGDIIETGSHFINEMDYFYVAQSQGIGTWCFFLVNLLELDNALEKHKGETQKLRDAFAEEYTINNGRRLQKSTNERNIKTDMTLIKAIGEIQDETVIRSYQY